MEAVHVVGWGVLPGEEGEVEVTAGRRDVGQLPATEPTNERALSGVTVVYLHVVVLAVITEVGRKVNVITGLTHKGPYPLGHFGKIGTIIGAIIGGRWHYPKTCCGRPL